MFKLKLSSSAQATDKRSAMRVKYLERSADLYFLINMGKGGSVEASKARA